MWYRVIGRCVLQHCGRCPQSHETKSNLRNDNQRLKKRVSAANSGSAGVIPC